MQKHVFFQYIACSFQKDVNLGFLKTNGLHVQKYCNGVAVTMSVTGFGPLSVSCWFVDIYSFKFVQRTFFHTFYVIEMKPDNLTRPGGHNFTLKYIRKTSNDFLS